MQQFRPLASYLQEDDAADVDLSISGHKSEEFSAPKAIPSMPIYMLANRTQERRTDDVAVASIPGQPETGTLSLLAALQSTMSVDTGERVVFIPAEKKRARTTEPLATPRRRMSLRLRHALVGGVVFLVMATTLLSLSPLASGQGGFQAFGSFGHWVSQQAMNWTIQSHDSSEQQQGSSQSYNPAPPPMNLPKSQYIAIAQQDATNAGISPVYFVRQINQESGFNPNAYSPAGAEGIAQFEPGTAAGLGINPWNPVQALQAAAKLMASYNKSYGGNYAMALAAYNGGSGTLKYAINACGSANWMNCLPYETRHYIYVIMGI
jgi:soluble lytic murein transglycosylase-like protein